MPDPNAEPLLAYLREHGSKYDRAALRAHLIEQGHDPAAIEWAIARYEREEQAAPPTKRSPWRIVLGCLGGLVLGLVSFVAIIFGTCSFEGGGTNNLQHTVLAVGIAVGIGAVWIALYPIFRKRE